MNRTKKFLNNFLFTGLQQIVVFICGFVSVSVVLNNYGSEMNGLVNSVNQLITYFKLVEAGLSGAAIYALYKPIADNDTLRINSIVSTSRNFYIKSGYVFVILTFLLALIYPLFIVSGNLSFISVFLLVLTLGISGSLEFFTLAKYRVFLTANQKNYILSIASSLYLLVNTAVICILAYMQINFILLWFLASLTIFVRSFILIFYVKKNYSNIDFYAKPDYSTLNQRWDAVYMQILGAIQVGMPIVILTFINKDLILISIYAIFSLVITGVNGILGVFKSGLFSAFGELIAKKESRKFQKAYQEFEVIFYSVLIVVYSVTFISIMPFIKIYTSKVDDVNYNLPLVGLLFVINSLFYNIKVPQGMLIQSSGKFRETRKQVTIQAFLIIILGVLLAPKFGIEGVLVASIISNLYRYIDLLIFVPKNITLLPIIDSLKRSARVIIIVFLVLFVYNNLPVQTVNDYWDWIILVAKVMLIAIIFVVLNLVIFDRVHLKRIISRFKFLFK